MIFKKSNRFLFLALLPSVFIASCQESIMQQEIDSTKINERSVIEKNDSRLVLSDMIDTSINNMSPLKKSSKSSTVRNYIVDFRIIAGGSSSIQCPTGYSKNSVDLNQGVGGDYIYLCHTFDDQKVVNPFAINTPTTEMLVRKCYSFDYTIGQFGFCADGNDYWSDAWADSWTRMAWAVNGETVNPDYNRGAGGAYVQSFNRMLADGGLQPYGSGHPLSGIGIVTNNAATPAGWTKINTNLNYGLLGSKIYIIYQPL